MPRVTIRLSNSEADALAQLPGKDTSARVRCLLHQSSLVCAIRTEIERALVAKVPGMATQTNPTHEALSVTEFRVALSVIVGLIGTMLPVDKRTLAAKAGERILDGIQATAGDVKSAIQAASSQPAPVRAVVKTEHPSRPATGAGAAAEILDIFDSTEGKPS